MTYYLYFYLDPRKLGQFTYNNVSFLYEPFYVGKGKNDRCYSHIKEATNSPVNNYKLNKIRKIINNNMLPIILIAEYGTEQSILDKETAYIQQIGRLIYNSGPLTNIKKDNSAYNKRSVPKPHYNKRPSKTVIHNITNEMYQVELGKLSQFINNNFSLNDDWHRNKANNKMSRAGKNNGMFGKQSKSKNKRWVLIGSESFLMSLDDINELTIPYEFGRKVPKNSLKARQRVIIKNTNRSKYMSNEDIQTLPDGTEYQIGLLWREHRETFTVRKN